MQEQDTSRRRKFYDQMSEAYDLGTFEEFDEKMNNPESRRKLHDFIDKDGRYDIGDFAYFDEAMRPTEPSAPQKPVTQATQAPAEYAQPTNAAGDTLDHNGQPYSQEVLRRYNSQDTGSGTFKDLSQIAKEVEREQMGPTDPALDEGARVGASLGMIAAMQRQPQPQQQENPFSAENPSMMQPKPISVPLMFKDANQQSQNPDLSKQWIKERAAEEAVSADTEVDFAERMETLRQSGNAEAARLMNRKEFDQRNFDNFYKSHVAPVFGEERAAGEKQVQEALAESKKEDESSGTFNIPTGHAGFAKAFETAVAKEKYTDPKKIADATLKRVQDDNGAGGFGDYVLSRMGINGGGDGEDGDQPQLSEREKEWMKRLFAQETNEVADKIISRIYDQYQQEGAPQSVLEYIGGKALHENMVSSLYDALVRRAADSSGIRAQLRAMAYEDFGKDQGWLTRVAGGAAPFAVDMIAGGFALPNIVGKAVVKGGTKLAAREVTKQMERRAAARGLEDAALKEAVKGGEEVAQRYLATQAPILNLAINAAGSAANFATYDVQSEAIRQIANGEFKPVDIMKAAGHGAALGGMMGATGGVIANATRNSGLLGKIAGDVAGLGAETAIFGLSSGLQKAIDEGIDIADVDWADTTGEAFSTVVGMKTVGAVMHPKNFLDRYRKSKDYDLKLNQRDLDELKAAGYDLDGIFKGLGKFGKIKPMEGNTIGKAKEITIGNYGKEAKTEEAWVDADNYKAILENPEISTSAKRKIVYLATGKVLTPEPVFGATLNVDEDGHATITTTNAYGAPIETKDYKTEEEAQKDYEKLQQISRTNTVGGLERVAQVAGMPIVVDEAKGRTKNETGVDVDDLDQMSDLDDAHFNTVMDAYTKNLQDAYMEHFNERLKKFGEAKEDTRPTDNGAAAGGGGENPAYETGGGSTQPPAGATAGGGATISQERTERRDAAYYRGMAVAENEDDLPAIGQSARLATARLMQQMPDDNPQLAELRNRIMQAIEEREEEADRLIDEALLTPQQREAFEQWRDAIETQYGIDDAVTAQTEQFEDQRRAQLEAIADPQGNVTQLQLKDGTTAYYKSGDLTNHFGGVMAVTGNGETVQLPVRDIADIDQPINVDDILARDVEQYAADLTDRYQAMFDGTMLTEGQQVGLMMAGQPFTATVVGSDPQGNIIFQMEDGSQMPMRPEDAQAAIAEADAARIEQQLTAEAETARLAEQQERFSRSIQGYAEGQPDLSAAGTDAKAASEYLMEQFAASGQDPEKARKQYLTDIQNTKEQLKQRMEDAQQELARLTNLMAGNEDMMDAEDIERNRQQMSQLQQSIADIRQRQQKYGDLRRELMNADEVNQMEQERRKVIFKARSGYQPTLPQRNLLSGEDRIIMEDGRPNFGLTPVSNANNYLLNHFQESADAEQFVNEQRLALRNKQRDEVQPEINRRNDILNAYASGHLELTADEVAQLAHEVANLEAQQDALSKEAIRLREIVDGIPALYERNGREEELTPAEQRGKALDKAKSKDDKLRIARTLYNNYPEALDVINDQEPRDLEEFIADNLGLGSMNWEGRDVAGRHVNGVREAVFGKKNATRGIGKEYDTNAFNQYLAKTGEGKGFDEIVHGLYEAQPDVDGSLRWSTEDIRDALENMLRSAQKPSDISNRIIDSRIAEAEAIVQRQEDLDREAEEEAKYQELQQWAEAHHLNPEEVEAYQDYLAEKPWEFDEEVINQIIADNESKQIDRSKALDSEHPDGSVGSEGEGGESQVPERSAGEGTEENQAVVGQPGTEGGTGVETLPDNDVLGGAQASAEHLNAVKGKVEQHLKKYRTLAPVDILSVESDEDMRKIGGDEYEKVRETLKERKLPAAYDPVSNRIYIFAENISEEDVEQGIFHENIHRGLQQYYGDGLREVAEAFWETESPDKPELSREGKRNTEKAYADKPEDIKEEYLTLLLGLHMTKGSVDKILSRLSPEHQEIIGNILKNIGYDREKETAARQGADQGTSGEHEELEDNNGPASGGRIIQGLDGYTEKDVTDLVSQHFNDLVGDEGLEIVDMKVIGSRTNGTAKDDSDLDVLLEYKGDMSEDGLFNILNDEENRLTINGIPVDINPITKGKSGTIDQWLERNKDYQKEDASFPARLAKAKAETDTNPTDAQKEAGNYKMGHIRFGGYQMSIENPKGSTRSGVDRNSKPWSIEMQDTYGYIGKKYGTDGDHLDFFINDNADLDNFEGRVYVVDQKNEDGTFDEHKVMYGYPSWSAAKKAYGRNYEPGWWDKHVMQMTGVKKDDFDKWLADSDHKTKPFADYYRTKMAETVSNPADQLMADVADRQAAVAQIEAAADERRRIVERLQNEPTTGDNAVGHLSDAYKLGDKETIRDIVDRVRDIVKADEEIMMDDNIDPDWVEDYDGNDPDLLAQKYIVRLIRHYFTDYDDDIPYIVTGIESPKDRPHIPESIRYAVEAFLVNDRKLGKGELKGDDLHKAMRQQNEMAANIQPMLSRLSEEQLEQTAKALEDFQDTAPVIAVQMEQEKRAEKQEAIDKVMAEVEKRKEQNMMPVQPSISDTEMQYMDEDQLTQRRHKAKADLMTSADLLATNSRLKPGGPKYEQLVKNILQAEADINAIDEEIERRANFDQYDFQIENNVANEPAPEPVVRQLSTKAVIKVLDDAKVPIKQVSQEEADQMMELFTAMNQQAITDYAIQMRESDRQRYAVINVRDPYAVPWYFEKKKFAEEYRVWGNRMGGKFQTLDLDKDESGNNVQNNDNIKFMFDDGAESKPTFVSNALKAVEGISQEKATPDQWLAMIQKNGGLKAGEDKWLGLSDWLNEQKAAGKKSITKQEVEDYIRQNQIQIEEQHYADEMNLLSDSLEREMPGFKNAFELDTTTWEEPYVNIINKRKAIELFNKYNEHNTIDPENYDKYDLGEISEWVIDEVSKVRPNVFVKPINLTRISYTTSGLKNLREIALVVPTIEPYNEHDDVHFGDAGKGRAIAWIRFGDALGAKDENQKDAFTNYLVKMAEKYGVDFLHGENVVDKMTPEEKDEARRLRKLSSGTEKVLVIDEIQSKRHQDAREKGYGDPSKVEKQYKDALDQKTDYTQYLYDKYPSAKSLTQLEKLATPEEMEKFYQLDKEEDRLYKERLAARELVPDAPFEKNWHELAMKRMLRYAAENGYDKIAWTTGNQQAERYSLSKAFDSVEREDNPSVKGRRFMFSGKNVENFIVDEEGKVIDSTISEAIDKPLSELVGKDMAVKLMGLENGDLLEGEDLRIGGEGMKGFYDQILPRFMDKYGKKWGVKTGEIDLPDLEESAQKMHSIDVTPEMKESVMQGQPMFQKGTGGRIYGWTDGKKIFLAPIGMNPNSPMHEYTHIWDMYIEKHDPQLWKEMVRTFKQTAAWKEIRENPNYRNIWEDENRMASEVHSRLTGARSQEEFEKAAADPNNKDTESIIEAVRDVLRRFWEKIAGLFGHGRDRLEEFILMPLRDALKGFNPITGDETLDPTAMIVQMSRPNKYGLNESDPRGKAVSEIKKQGGSGVLAGYADKKTGDYVLLGDDARRMQTLGGKGVMTKENGMDALRMTSRQFDDVSPVLVHKGYRIAIADLEATERQPRRSETKSEPQDNTRLRGLMRGREERDADYLQTLIGQQKEYIEQLQKAIPREQGLYDAWQKAIGTKDEDTARSRYEKYYDNHEADIRLLDSARLQLDDLEKELAGKQEKAPAAEVRLKVDRRPPVQSLIQGELFSDKDFEPLPEKKEEKPAKSTKAEQPASKKAEQPANMSDEDLLKAIGETDGKQRRKYIDAYDQRHLQEQNEENDAYYEMLDSSETTLEDAYGMYDSVFRQFKDGGYASPERTKLLAQIDALESYIEWQEEREAERRMEEEEEAEAAQQATVPDEARQKFEQQQKGVRPIGFDLTQMRLRHLEEGETCHVERRYVENGTFSFTGKERIESIDDVAYIFKQLEDAAVENTFLVLEKDGVPTIIHLATGLYTASYAKADPALAAYNELQPDKVYFIHNHPSGNLKCSKADEDVLRSMKKIFGDKLQPGIIIDTKSGKYGLFGMGIPVSPSTQNKMPEKVEGEVPMKVYSFSKQVFDQGWNPETAFDAGTPSKVAQFVSSHRLGDHKKTSLLVMTQNWKVTGNVFLPWTTLKEAVTAEAADLIARYMNQMGGTIVTLYGDYDFNDADKENLRELKSMLQDRGVYLADVVHVEGNNYKSAHEMGMVGEPGADMPQGDEGKVYRHTTPEIEKVNTRFNRELDRQINDPTFPTDHIYKLGKPGAILLSTGFPNDNIEMSASHLLEKSIKAQHPFDLADVKDLVKAINDPVAVFSYGDKDKAQNVIVELEKDGKRFMVGVHFKQGYRGTEISDIRGIFPRDNSDWINWISQKKHLYLDKEKIQNLIAQQRRILAEVGHLDLNSVAKLIKDFNNPKLSEENLKKIFPTYVVAAEETADMLGGVKVVFESEATEKGTLGWYDPNDNTVHVVLPEHSDANEVRRTVCHEKLGHEGLVALLGSQDEVDKFGQFVFKSAGKSLRQRIIDKANENDPGWKDHLRFSHAAQEVVADIAEEGPRTAEEFSLWDKIKHYLIRFLNKMGWRIRGLINDHDLAYYILKTGEALKKWNQMPESDRTAASRQATEYDIMRSRRGKPRKRNDESMAQYLQRLREWEKWKIAEERARENNDPMPDAEQINERWHEQFNQDVAEWRMRNGIPADAEGLGAFPKRETGETPQDYAARVADYETQKDAWADAPKVFDYLQRANEEYQRLYREWKERYGLAEAANVDLGLYEGDPDSLPHIVDPEDLEADMRAEADLVEAVGIDMSREGARRHAKLSLIERRKNLESSNAEDAVWIHDIVNSINMEAYRQGVDPKQLREAMADIIEGTYFEDVIKDDAGNVIAVEDISDRLPIKMTTGLRDILATIKDWYDEFYHVIEDAGLRNDAGYIEEGYVNHVWSKEKSSPEAWKKHVENFQRTKSPNMRERMFKTYRDGRDVGLVPKFSDIADILAYYSVSNNEAVANKKFLDDLSFIVVEEQNTDGEVVSVLPLLNSSKPNIAVSDRYQMYHVPGVGDVYVLKDIQRTFANVFGTMRTQDIPEWLSQTGKVYDTVSSTAKKIELSFSAFHMGALTEVAMAQMRPDRALRALAQYIFLDCAKAGTIPAYAHPEDFKLAASHLVQLGATQDYSAADVNNVTEKLRDLVREMADSEQVAKKGAGYAATPVAYALDMVNKGMDKVLWNYLHDGLKIACFKMFAEQIEKRVEKQGLSAEQREQLLDEAGQYVNDTFGGQYWELLNVSPALIKWLRRGFLSPDWLVSTQRHFLANFGFGSIYSESGFLNYLRYNRDNIKRAFGVDIPRDENRRFRSKNAKQCYLLGVCGFFYVMMNALNAMFRAQDEEKEKEKADEARRDNPAYQSPYELAYPDGMKWYDYTMYGNTIGQQTHLFLGRYDDGTEWYARWGKQFREFPELFMGRHGVEFPTPLMERMSGKANPIGRYLLYDLPLTVGMYGYKQPRETQEIAEKYGNTVALLAMTAKKFLPYSVPTQQDKEFKMFDLVMPSQKGFTRWKAVDYFKTYIQGGDMDGVMRTYNAAVMNGIDAEDCLKAAIATVKATQRKELADGITDLQSAMNAYDAEKDTAEKKRLRRKIFAYLAEQDYKAFTRDEARSQVESFLNGDQPKENDNDINKYVRLATSADVRDEYRLEKVRKVAKKYADEVKTADGDRQRKLEDTYGNWLDIYDIITKANRDINRLKRQLGKEGEDDAATMDEIRTIRRETQKEVDEIQAP